MDATIWDVGDLATLRGGSLALLDAPARAGRVLDGLKASGRVQDHALIFAGASQGAFKVWCDDGAAVAAAVRDAMRGLTMAGVAGEPVYGHLSIKVVAEPVTGDDVAAALLRAEAAINLGQLQDLTVPVPLSAGTLPCAMDRKRPAETKIHAKGKALMVSASVAARRAYGGTRDGEGRRQGFYISDLGLDPLQVPVIIDDFEDLVTERAGLAESLERKMAVVHMDGNGFGALRKRLVSESGVPMEEALAHFSREVRALRKTLAMKLAAYVGERTCGLFGSDQKLRLETLLWGGDEARWVMPGWLAWDLIGTLFKLVGGWTIPALGACPALPLSHGFSVVVCNVKTPIRQVIGLSDRLTDLAKESGAVDACQWEIMDGVDIPDDLLSAHHRALYGDAPRRAFSLEAEGWTAATAQITKVKEVFPRSQLYHLLRLAVANGGLRAASADAEPVKAVLTELACVLERNEYPLTEDDVLSAAMPGSGTGPLVPLALLAQLWDYVNFTGKEAGDV